MYIFQKFPRKIPIFAICLLTYFSIIILEFVILVRKCVPAVPDSRAVYAEFGQRLHVEQFFHSDSGDASFREVQNL